MSGVLHNGLKTRNVTLALQHMEVLCYNRVIIKLCVEKKNGFEVIGGYYDILTIK